MNPTSFGQVDGVDGDEELVSRVAQGSDLALASLYDRHASAVFRTALSVSRDRGVAEEVVQETFLTLWDRAERFDPARGSLSAWLSTIARNRAIDRHRANSRRLDAAPFSVLTADQPDPAATVEWLVAAGRLVGAGAPEPEPDVAVTRSEAGVAVETALIDLTAPERQAILLAYRDGLTQSEISTHLGWPLGTVKTRSRRALRRLRVALEPMAATRTPSSLERQPDRLALVPGAPEPCAAPC